MESKDIVFPWQRPPLDKWRICGMNHYRQDGRDMLFVSMTKNGKCITCEGVDNWVVWNNLSILADQQEEMDEISLLASRVDDSNDKQDWTSCAVELPEANVPCFVKSSSGHIALAYIQHEGQEICWCEHQEGGIYDLESYEAGDGYYCEWMPLPKQEITE